MKIQKLYRKTRFRSALSLSQTSGPICPKRSDFIRISGKYPCGSSWSSATEEIIQFGPSPAASDRSTREEVLPSRPIDWIDMLRAPVVALIAAVIFFPVTWAILELMKLLAD